jgi:hypothetical protein
MAMWLPPRVARLQEAEDARERRETRREEAERAEAAEAAADKSLSAYRLAAEARGESVSAVALATGEGIGRSMADVFADAVAAADHEDARQGAKAKREAGIEPDHVMVGRSDGWPESAYQADRQIRRADELHRDLVRYKAARTYPAAVEAARSKAEPFVERASGSVPMIYR